MKLVRAIVRSLAPRAFGTQDDQPFPRNASTCRVERSRDISNYTVKNRLRLTRSLPAHSAYGLPVYVVACQATPFLDCAWNDKSAVVCALRTARAAQSSLRL